MTDLGNQNKLIRYRRQKTNTQEPKRDHDYANNDSAIAVVYLNYLLKIYRDNLTYKRPRKRIRPSIARTTYTLKGNIKNIFCCSDTTWFTASAITRGGSRNFYKWSKSLYSSFLIVKYKFFRKNWRQGKFEKIRDVTIAIKLYWSKYWPD